MIPHQNNRATLIGGAQATASFEISVEDSAHIMGILRDTLYTDKVLAVLREYSANAWDAHRSIGKPELPISVTLPDDDDATLRIRDFGPGLSHEDVFSVYTQYGKSTKRDSNEVVGQLGIGSKSGFAYADSFTIVSWHGGMRRTYVAVLDESEKGAINLLDETACEPTETGVEIQIAVRHSDIYEFQRTAKRLFRHFTPRPAINIELPALPDEQTVLEAGVITPGGGDWIAIMGCVPYRISLDALDPRTIPACLRSVSGQLKFGIGEVAMSASREELKYNPATKAALASKFTLLVDEFVTHALKQLEAGVFTGWETRLRVQVLAKMDLPLPEKWKPYAEGFAKVTYTYDDFSIIHNKSACTRLLVTDSTVLLIDDTGKDLGGYMFGHDDYVVRSQTKTPEELRASLDAALVASGLVGVKIELLSTRHWNAPYVEPKRKTNPKHRARMFVLDTTQSSFCAPWSDNWNAVTRIPTADDVWVIIEGFKPHHSDFFRHYTSDRQLANAFGVTMPAVYGYKTTEKKPVDKATLEGVTYEKWREAFLEDLLTPENIELIALHWRANPRDDRHSYYGGMSVPGAKACKWVTERLGENHPIVEWLTGWVDAQKAIKSEISGAIGTLAERSGNTWDKSAAKVAYADIKKRYPLLRRTGFSELWCDPYNAEAREVREEWARYIEIFDSALAPSPANVVQFKSVP
jgi:hypothetical protein